MRKIGFYGGTFDPIHFGHLNLAIEISEKHQLDEVLFSPAFINPHKQAVTSLASIAHRLQMTRLAIEDIPHFKVIDIEANKKSISYTVDTLRELKEQYKDSQLFFILGADSLNEFSNWKNPDEILSLASPLIGVRDSNYLEPHIKYYKEFQEGMTKTKSLEISSTEIRKRIQMHAYIRHLVPSKVVDYIYENCLY